MGRSSWKMTIVAAMAVGLIGGVARAGHSHFELEPVDGALVVPGIGPLGTFSPHNPQIDENTWYWDPPINTQFRKYVTDDPGLMESAGFYQPDAAFTWHITSGLKFYDPGAGAWGTPLNDEQLILTSGTYGFEVTVDGTSGMQSTGEWAKAENDGSIHAHAIFSLTRASNSSSNPVLPADGVYAFQGYMSSDKYADSNPFHMAFGLNAGEGPGSTMFDALSALPPIPEPASMILLGAGAMAILGRRRR
jgi:hypothetical protein